MTRDVRWTCVEMRLLAREVDGVDVDMRGGLGNLVGGRRNVTPSITALSILRDTTMTF